MASLFGPFEFGVMARRADKHEASVRMFRKCLAAGPPSGVVGTEREAAACFNLGASLAALQIRPEDDEEALALLKRAAKLDATLSEARTDAAALLVRLGRLEDALLECDAVLANEPHHSHAWYNLNTALRQAGRMNNALARSWAAVADITGGDLAGPPTPWAAAGAAGAGACAGSAEGAAGEPAAVVVVCVKWGTKYDADYVNKLADGVRRSQKIASPHAAARCGTLLALHHRVRRPSSTHSGTAASLPASPRRVLHGRPRGYRRLHHDGCTPADRWHEWLVVRRVRHMSPT